ncbi:hypothetical protein [Chryseolinea sp. H1M3-3]|uniref:hypothetical protein n=1 Tax=Chryseolinea sp. H1M3-3 TaxID=3034144 RepID=UPI0023EBA3B9|nr:hypothetical protein [Chryseolinea sp. H1M3-3]
MKSYLLFLTFIIMTPSFAQDTGYLHGYIVTNENDTILGLVKNKNFTPYRVLQDIKFKKEKSGEMETYAPKDLKSFQVGSSRYVSKKFGEDDLSFFEVLIEGDLNYYELRVTGFGTGNETVYQMLQKKNEDAFFSVYGPNFQERLLAYFADEPILSEKIKAGTYKRNNIDKLVKEYNLMKYIPQPSKTRKTATVSFYKRLSKTNAELFLVFNDTLEYRIPDKYFFTLNVPVDVRTKVCFGTKDNKSCTLISMLPHYPFPDYYELQTGGAKLKFNIEKRLQNQAQQDIAELGR